jgi:phosphatidylglycerophosphatase A
MAPNDQATGTDRSDKAGIPFVTRLIATGCFSGYSPWAPGTCGSLVGLLIYVLIPHSDNPLVLGGGILLAFLVGVPAAARVAAIEGPRLTKSAELLKATFQPGPHLTPDPSIVVIDEIVGMWISVFLIPKALPAVALAFFIFRGFDIVKPFPARQCERIPGGWGIMMDDVIAGIYANVATQILYRILLAAAPQLF